MYTYVNICDAMKTTSLSVRVDDDDAAFLAGLSLGDARTPSEKLRLLLQAERRRQEGIGDPLEAADMFRDLLAPAKQRIRRMEKETGARSDFAARLYERLPEIAGATFAGPGASKKEAAAALAAFESDILNDVFALILEILELGLTTKNRCYDSRGIKKRLRPLLEIIELINMSEHKGKRGTNG